MESFSPPEQNHEITPKLEEAFALNEDCCPGINCCAVCGKQEKKGGGTLIECPTCLRVAYCSTSCMEVDVAVHRRVCGVLKEIGENGDIAYTAENGITSGTTERAEATVIMEKLITLLSEKGLPGDWANLFGMDKLAAAKAAASVAPLSSCSQLSSSTAAEESQRFSCTHRRVSAHLSYCCSIGWCLRHVPCVAHLRRRLAQRIPCHTVGDVSIREEDAWVDLLLLGAGPAECGVSPRSLWALVVNEPERHQHSGAASASELQNRFAVGLRLTFVGPEVPEGLHGQKGVIDLPYGTRSSTGCGIGSSCSIGDREVDNVNDDDDDNDSLNSDAARGLDGRRLCLRHFRGKLTEYLLHGGDIFQSDDKHLLEHEDRRQKDAEECHTGCKVTALASGKKRPSDVRIEANADKINCEKNRNADSQRQNSVRCKVDAIFGFNLGLTCPDYDWATSAAALAQPRTSPSSVATLGKPLLMITNTLMELMMDRECLEDDHGVVLLETKKKRKKILMSSSSSSSCDKEMRFGTRNPFSWIPWRQSGTLGNDVYRKNSHIAAGYICNSAEILDQQARAAVATQTTSLGMPSAYQQGKSKKRGPANKASKRQGKRKKKGNR